MSASPRQLDLPDLVSAAGARLTLSVIHSGKLIQIVAPATIRFDVVASRRTARPERLIHNLDDAVKQAMQIII